MAERVVLVVDGAADAAWDGKTMPSAGLLGTAMPALRGLATEGTLLRVRTVPSATEPSTDAALAELLGLDTVVRGPVEAAGLGLEGAWAWRVDVVRVDSEGSLVDATPKLTPPERAAATEMLRVAAGPQLRIVECDAWRLVAVAWDRIGATPGWPAPHQSIGAVLDAMPSSAFESYAQEANLKLRDLGIGVWPWGGGPMSAPPSAGNDVTVVAAATVVRGVALLAGAAVVTPTGATGDTDTDLAAKLAAAVAAGGTVVVHVDGADAAAHRRSADGREAFLARVDREVVAPLAGSGVPLLVLTDHVTDAATGRHETGCVPAVLSDRAWQDGGVVAMRDLLPWFVAGKAPSLGLAGVDCVLLDVGGTLVAEAAPGTAVAELRVESLPGVHEALEALARRYVLGAVTNTSVMTAPDVDALLEPAGLGRHLAAIVTSYDVGVAKPDPLPFREAARTLGVEPGRCVYVGDRDTDAAAAAAAGMRYLAVEDIGLASVLDRLLVDPNTVGRTHATS